MTPDQVDTAIFPILVVVVILLVGWFAYRILTLPEPDDDKDN